MPWNKGWQKSWTLLVELERVQACSGREVWKLGLRPKADVSEEPCSEWRGKYFATDRIAVLSCRVPNTVCSIWEWRDCKFIHGPASHFLYMQDFLFVTSLTEFCFTVSWVEAYMLLIKASQLTCSNFSSWHFELYSVKYFYLRLNTGNIWNLFLMSWLLCWP